MPRLTLQIFQYTPVQSLLHLSNVDMLIVSLFIKVSLTTSSLSKSSLSGVSKRTFASSIAQCTRDFAGSSRSLRMGPDMVLSMITVPVCPGNKAIGFLSHGDKLKDHCVIDHNNCQDQRSHTNTTIYRVYITWSNNLHHYINQWIVT